MDGPNEGALVVVMHGVCVCVLFLIAAENKTRSIVSYRIELVHGPLWLVPCGVQGARTSCVCDAPFPTVLSSVPCLPVLSTYM